MLQSSILLIIYAFNLSFRYSAFSFSFSSHSCSKCNCSNPACSHNSSRRILSPSHDLSSSSINFFKAICTTATNVYNLKERLKTLNLPSGENTKKKKNIFLITLTIFRALKDAYSCLMSYETILESEVYSYKHE